MAALIMLMEGIHPFFMFIAAAVLPGTRYDRENSLCRAPVLIGGQLPLCFLPLTGYCSLPLDPAGNEGPPTK